MKTKSSASVYFKRPVKQSLEDNKRLQRDYLKLDYKTED